MARIVCISKYPPLEGGISAKTYWLTKALGDLGHEVHVVTDRPGVAPEYSHPMEDRELALKNVFIHRPHGDIPWHIPDDKHRVLDLLNMAIEITNEVNPDVIDTGYLVPYGIAGYLTSQATGVPFVVRHGGSDLRKFMEAGIWGTLFEKALSAAAMVITDWIHATLFNGYRVFLIPPYVPDPAFFNPNNRKADDKPILAIVGKANYYWRHKSWHRIAAIMDLVGSEFQYLNISQGIGLSDFKEFVGESAKRANVKWETFVPLWKMPDLLKRVDGLFVFNGELLFPAFSNLVLEGLYSGTTLITDSRDLARHYEKEGITVSDLPGEILAVSANEPHQAASQIIDYFKNRKISHSLPLSAERDYQQYVTANEEALLEGAHRSRDSSVTQNEQNIYNL